MESDISTIKISALCIKTIPCKHDIVISYKDGSIEEVVLSSPQIAAKYWEYLSEDIQDHLLTEPSVLRSREQY